MRFYAQCAFLVVALVAGLMCVLLSADAEVVTIGKTLVGVFVGGFAFLFQEKATLPGSQG